MHALPWPRWTSENSYSAPLNPKPRNLSSGEAHNVEFTLKNGIPSTAMSSFNHLSEQEFNAVRDYALYLEERAKKWGSLLGGESE